MYISIIYNRSHNYLNSWLSKRFCLVPVSLYDNGCTIQHSFSCDQQPDCSTQVETVVQGKVYNIMNDFYWHFLWLLRTFPMFWWIQIRRRLASSFGEGQRAKRGPGLTYTSSFSLHFLAKTLPDSLNLAMKALGKTCLHYSLPLCPSDNSLFKLGTKTNCWNYHMRNSTTTL